MIPYWNECWEFPTMYPFLTEWLRRFWGKCPRKLKNNGHFKTQRNINFAVAQTKPCLFKPHRNFQMNVPSSSFASFVCSAGMVKSRRWELLALLLLEEWCEKEDDWEEKVREANWWDRGELEFILKVWSAQRCPWSRAEAREKATARGMRASDDIVVQPRRVTKSPGGSQCKKGRHACRSKPCAQARAEVAGCR